MTIERVFIVGGTGNIGKRVVQDLIDNQIPVTLYTRTPSKVQSHALIQTVQGDFSDLSALKQGIQGHTRLFLLVSDMSRFVNTKTEIAQLAYDAGIQQIVDVSSFGVNIGWRTSAIGVVHYLAEQAIFELKNRKFFVALRAGRFMSNHLTMAAPKRDGALFDTYQPDEQQGWISTEDIGAVAAVVLREPVEKHGNAVYNLTGEVLTSKERAAVISRVVGKEIPYVTVPVLAKYDKLMESGHVPHVLAVDLCDNMQLVPNDIVNPAIEILLRRKPQTLEEYLTANKDKIQ